MYSKNAQVIKFYKKLRTQGYSCLDAFVIAKSNIQALIQTGLWYGVS